MMVQIRLATEIFYHLVANAQALLVQKLTSNAMRFHHTLLNLFTALSRREMKMTPSAFAYQVCNRCTWVFQANQEIFLLAGGRTQQHNCFLLARNQPQCARLLPSAVRCFSKRCCSRPSFNHLRTESSNRHSRKRSLLLSYPLALGFSLSSTECSDHSWPGHQGETPSTASSASVFEPCTGTA